MYVAVLSVIALFCIIVDVSCTIVTIFSKVGFVVTAPLNQLPSDLSACSGGCMVILIPRPSGHTIWVGELSGTLHAIIDILGMHSDIVWIWQNGMINCDAM